MFRITQLKKAILFLSFILISASGFSQKAKQFDEDVEKYPEVVAEMFPSNVSDNDKALISKFIGEWGSGTFTNTEKAEIANISNAFLSKKARNIHYWLFWRCLLSFKKTENSGTGYDVWIKAMVAAGQDRKSTPTSLQTLMNATLALLDKHLIYTSAGNDWKCSNNDFRFDFTDDQLSVIVGNCDLYCYSKGDSIMIGQTSGRYSVNDQRWRGNGGMVTWERAGIAPSEVSARLGEYSINMKQSQYEADSVWITYSTYFSAPVLGKLIDRVRHNSSPEAALFPEFITYNKKFIFKDLYPGITYEGGISVQGSRVIGAGTDDEKATIQIQKSDSLRMDIKSKSFLFRKDRVNARNVSLNIYMNEDSIFHNNLQFVYLVEASEASFIRSDAASSQAPYNNSYHKLDMNFEQLIWKTDEPLMSMSMMKGSAVGRAQFRSQNYFDQQYFESLQYYDAVHPLVAIRQCAAKWGSETFPSEVYANHIRRSVSDARVQLIEIAKLGFIIFDSDKDEATVQPQMHDFMAAAAKKTDFDVIDLRSLVNAPERNAMLNTNNHDLIINGIERFMVSDSQQVTITPKNQQVVMKKNRAIDIKGRINAGQIQVHGDSLYFDYDTFKIDLFKADSLYMFVPTGEKDRLGKPRYRRLKTAVEKLSGNIQIDQPGNKSGRENTVGFPILYSDSASYVFYESSDISGGVYSAESFFFELDPFIIDNIDNFPKESLELNGRFASAGIFDDMRQTLRVQPDYSLGFVFENSDSAISTYKVAKLIAEVRMSNEGLEASGKLDYLTTSIQSDDIKFYPDSMNVSEAKNLTISKQTEGTEYPELQSERSRIHWEPKDEKMYIYKKDKNFNLYNPETQFDGSLLLTPQNLSGKGRVDLGTADIRSDSITFKANTFASDTSVFRLKTVKDGPYQVVTVDSVRSEIDFNTRKGKFIPGKDYALVQFPSNKFSAYIDGMIWDMDDEKIHIGTLDTVTRPIKNPVDFKYQYPGEGKGARYFSTARDADSLNFVASRATFNLKSGDMNAEGVTLVKSSDAIVYPSDGKLTLNPDGSLEIIRNARVVFNDNLKQHTVHSADIKMLGRRQYSGFGKYDYIDETDKLSVIDMSWIGTDNNGKTSAKGNIPIDESFMLNPYFRYQGDMILSSDNQFPEFDGAIQIVEECETLRPDWFKIKSQVNPNNISFDIDEAPVNIKNNKIYNGLFLTNDSSRIYPAFFSSRRNYSDNPLIQVSGKLTYDRDSMTYFIAPESKLRNRDTIGNLFAFDRDRCIFSGEGKLSLGMNHGQVATDVVGRITHNRQATSLDVMMSLDFLFDDALAAMIANKIDSFPTLTGVDMQRPVFVRGMNEWLGVTKAQTYRRDALMGKVRNFPAELNKTLVLTQLQMHWNQSSRSYRSTGKIGVGNLFGHQVNRLVDGFVEISKRSGGDVMDIYLKLDDRNWFYFGYTRELMQVISSDRAFNERLMKLPEKQRKSDDKRPSFTYMIASSDKLEQFMRQFNRREITTDQVPTVIQDVSRPETTTPAPVAPVQVQAEEEETPIIEVE